MIIDDRNILILPLKLRGPGQFPLCPLFLGHNATALNMMLPPLPFVVECPCCSFHAALADSME